MSSRYPPQDVRPPNPALSLGIDPGLNKTGYALVEWVSNRPILREGGLIRSTRGKTLAQRVLEIHQGLQEVLNEHRPAVVAVEQLFSMGRNPKSALLMAHARGAILMTVAAAGLPLVQFSPTQVKKLLTGSGRASKEQIQHAVRTELRLRELLEPHDVADASAIALCVCHTLKFAA